MAKQKRDVAPGLQGKVVEHIECPNEMLSKVRGHVVGSYTEDGSLVLVVVGFDGKVHQMHSQWVRVEPEPEEER